MEKYTNKTIGKRVRKNDKTKNNKKQKTKYKKK